MITCAIGDIHGCACSLLNLLPQVINRADQIVFLGDYVDRGPASKEVVETIIELQASHPRVITLQGNHERMFFNYLAGGDSSVFFRTGGLQTLASYDLEPGATVKDLPAEHRHFFANLLPYWEDAHAIYVHAGLQPGRHLSLQQASWYLWAKENFIKNTYNFGKPVVFGHTAFSEPLVRPEKIGIDTGAVYGGRLTAVLLPEQEFISVPGEQKYPFLFEH
ncbi:MAG: metallophosphatase [Desulfobulbus propionicus]|nr:MAG: metallophosphatase [Desulfobulbus propionicus]